MDGILILYINYDKIICHQTSSKKNNNKEMKKRYTLSARMAPVITQIQQMEKKDNLATVP